MVMDIGEVLVLMGMVKLEMRGEATDVVMHPPLLTITMACGCRRRMHCQFGE